MNTPNIEEIAPMLYQKNEDLIKRIGECSHFIESIESVIYASLGGIAEKHEIKKLLDLYSQYSLEKAILMQMVLPQQSIIERKPPEFN